MRIVSRTLYLLCIYLLGACAGRESENPAGASAGNFELAPDATQQAACIERVNIIEDFCDRCGPFDNDAWGARCNFVTVEGDDPASDFIETSFTSVFTCLGTSAETVASEGERARVEACAATLATTQCEGAQAATASFPKACEPGGDDRGRELCEDVRQAVSDKCSACADTGLSVSWGIACGFTSVDACAWQAEVADDALEAKASACIDNLNAVTCTDIAVGSGAVFPDDCAFP